MNIETNIIGFHLPEEPYGFMSNWYRAEFDLGGRHYVSSEQYMMSRKVLTQHRYDLDEKIMQTSDPAEAKWLAGKENFTDCDVAMWKRIRYAIVKQGVSAKFRQHPKLAAQLLRTGNALLCECSKKDTDWGIGIDLTDKAYMDVQRWKGQNLLGRILMEVRDELRQLLNADQPAFIDAVNLPPIDEWKRTAGELRMIPKFYLAIHTYADALPDNFMRQAFYHSPLASVDIDMRTNMGGGLPIIGFYELKQDIYDITRMTSGVDR